MSKRSKFRNFRHGLFRRKMISFLRANGILVNKAWKNEVLKQMVAEKLQIDLHPDKVRSSDQIYQRLWYWSADHMMWKPREYSPEPGTSEEGFVYFVRGGDYIKIGFSTSVDKRFDSLQTACPYKLVLLKQVPGTQKTEKSYHRTFNHLKEHGEWFRVEKDLLRFIESLP